MGVKYLVASPGRSGSIFVTMTIAKSLRLQSVFSLSTENINSAVSIVRHTHDATLQLPNHDIVVVQPYRCNLFKELVSAVISETYNEWSDNSYTGNREPFVCDLDLFRIKYIWHKKWHQAFEHYTVYSNRVYLCFEDFIGNSSAVCKALDIPTCNLKTQKSPYSENNILNIDQLQQEFDILEKDQTIQTAPIENFTWVDLKAL
jgi:hypothetical protein